MANNLPVGRIGAGAGEGAPSIGADIKRPDMPQLFRDVLEGIVFGDYKTLEELQARLQNGEFDNYNDVSSVLLDSSIKFAGKKTLRTNPDIGYGEIGKYFSEPKPTRLWMRMILRLSPKLQHGGASEGDQNGNSNGMYFELMGYSSDAGSYYVQVESYADANYSNTTLAIDGAPSSGSFRLKFRDKITRSIAFDATNAQIIAALEKLPSIKAGNVRSGGNDANVLSDTIYIEFCNALGNRPIAASELQVIDGTDGDLIVSQNSEGAFAAKIGSEETNAELDLESMLGRFASVVFLADIFPNSRFPEGAFPDGMCLRHIFVDSQLKKVEAEQSGDHYFDYSDWYLIYWNRSGDNNPDKNFANVALIESVDGSPAKYPNPYGLLKKNELYALSLTPFTTDELTATVRAGETLQFKAVGYDAFGNVVQGIHPTFELKSGDGVLDADGLYHAPTSTGSVSVQARSGLHESSEASVDIVAGALASIVVSAASPYALSGGDQVQFIATGFDSFGNEIGALSGVTWSKVSGNGAIGASSGIFTTAAAGSSVLRATKSGIHGYSDPFEALAALASLADLNPDILLDANELALSDDDAVANFVDQSGNGYDFVQADAVKKGIFIENAALGNAAVNLGTLGDDRELVSSYIDQPVMTGFLVSRQHTQSVNRRRKTLNGSGWSIGADSANSRHFATEANATDADGINDGAFGIVAFRQDGHGAGKTCRLYVAGDLKAQLGTSGVSDLLNAKLGERLFDQGGDSDVALLGIIPAELSDADFFRAGRYLSSRYSVRWGSFIPAAQLTRIALTGGQSLALVGDAPVQLAASAFDQYGAAFAGTIIWASSDHAVATVSASGLVTVVGAGTSTITASIGSISTEIEFAVGEPLASLMDFNPDVLLDAQELALARGAAVSTYSDQSGNGNDFAQATAAKKPTFRPSRLASNAAVRLDDLDDDLVSAYVLPADCTIFNVAATDHNLGGGGYHTILKQSAADWRVQVGPDRHRFFYNGNTGGTYKLAVGAGVVAIDTIIQDSSSGVRFLGNGEESPSVIPYSAPSGHLDLSGGGVFGGDHLLLCVIPSLLSAIDLYRAGRYLSDRFKVKWGAATIPAARAGIITITGAKSVALTGDAPIQLAVDVKDQYGAARTAAVTWASSNAAIATVDSAGLVTIVGAGSCFITASQEGCIGDFALDVGEAISDLSDLGALDVLLDADALGLPDGRVVQNYADQSGNNRDFLSNEAYGIRVGADTGLNAFITNANPVYIPVGSKFAIQNSPFNNGSYTVTAISTNPSGVSTFTVAEPVTANEIYDDGANTSEMVVKAPFIRANAANFNGNDVLRFDAVNDRLVATGYKRPAPSTVIAVTSWRHNIGSAGGLQFLSDTSTRASELNQYPDGSVRYGNYPTALTSGAGTVIIDIPMILAVTQADDGGSAGAASLFVNGLRKASGVAAFTTLDDLVMGDAPLYAAHEMDGDNALLAIIPAVLEPIDVYRASRFLSARFGIAVP